MYRNNNNGFTLLEVMVALAIVALSLTAVTTSMSQMTYTAHILRDRTYASWIAQNHITELRLASEAPDVGSSNGEVQYVNRDWNLRTTIEETGVDNLYRIEVEVSLEGSDDNIRTVTGFFGPQGLPGEANRAWALSRTVNSGESNNQ